MQNTDVWIIPDKPNAYVVVSESVRKIFQQYRQLDTSSNEAGGLLIGYYRGAHIDIVDCTQPKVNDQRSRHGFDRKDWEHLREINFLYRKNNKKLVYVGEWHTHPELYPTPSSVDKQNWNKIARSRTNPTVFIIVGTQGLYCGYWETKLAKLNPQS